MYTIANWARHHKVAARFWLALLHTLLVVLAMLLCPMLAARHIAFSFGSVLPVCISGCGVVAAAGYLRTHTQDKGQRFWLQKFRFAITGICCLLLIISVLSSGSVFKLNAYNSLQGAFTEAAAVKKTSPYMKVMQIRKHFIRT